MSCNLLYANLYYSLVCILNFYFLYLEDFASSISYFALLLPFFIYPASYLALEMLSLWNSPLPGSPRWCRTILGFTILLSILLLLLYFIYSIRVLDTIIFLDLLEGFFYPAIGNIAGYIILSRLYSYISNLPLYLVLLL